MNRFVFLQHIIYIYYKRTTYDIPTSLYVLVKTLPIEYFETSSNFKVNLELNNELMKEKGLHKNEKLFLNKNLLSK